MTTTRGATPLLLALSVTTGALYLAVSISQQLFSDADARRPALVVYYLATIALFCSYAGILRSCRGKDTPFAGLAVLLGSPVAFHGFWILTTPALSIDLYSYLMDGFSAALGLNPYTNAPRDLGYTSFGLELARHGWRPTHGAAPYGPLWMSIIGALGRTGVSLWVAVVLVKALMAAATAGCALIIYRLVKEVRPDAALLASMAYWWNPTVLIEAAGEGHNDPLMALLMLLTIWCTMRQRFMAGALALTAGALIKYVPVLFAPALAVYQWRSTADRRLLASKMVATAACCVVITTVAFVPFWAGWSTFDGVQESARLKFTNGTSGVTFWGMSQLMGSANATYLTRIVLGAALLILVLHASWAVRDDQTLLAACTTISMFYVLVVTPRFWPWYVMLPTALLCASGRRPDIAVAFALTACARAVAPLDVIRFSNAISWPVQVWATTIVGVWVPALVWIAVSWVSVRRASVAPEPRRRARRWFSDEVTG